MRSGSFHPAGYVCHIQALNSVSQLLEPGTSSLPCSVCAPWIWPQCRWGMLTWTSPAGHAQRMGEVSPGPDVRLAHLGLFTTQPARHRSPWHTHLICLQSLLPSPQHPSLSTNLLIFPNPLRATHLNRYGQLWQLALELDIWNRERERRSTWNSMS